MDQKMVAPASHIGATMGGSRRCMTDSLVHGMAGFAVKQVILLFKFFQFFQFFQCSQFFQLFQIGVSLLSGLTTIGFTMFFLKNGSCRGIDPQLKSIGFAACVWKASNKTNACERCVDGSAWSFFK
jgi:hypothetical protein